MILYEALYTTKLDFKMMLYLTFHHNRFLQRGKSDVAEGPGAVTMAT